MVIKYLWLSWLHRKDSDEIIRNYALRLFRKNYGDINTTSHQLRRIYPNLTKDVITATLVTCKRANSFGVDLIYNAPTLQNKNNVFSDPALKALFYDTMIEKFPWMDKQNLNSIYQWTCYGKMLDMYDEI